MGFFLNASRKFSSRNIFVLFCLVHSCLKYYYVFERLGSGSGWKCKGEVWDEIFDLRFFSYFFFVHFGQPIVEYNEVSNSSSSTAFVMELSLLLLL